MKKELSQPMLIAIIAVAVLVLGVAGWFYFASVAGAEEPSADLRAKQIEYQKSLIPGGGGGMPPNQQGAKPDDSSNPSPQSGG